MMLIYFSGGGRVRVRVKGEIMQHLHLNQIYKAIALAFGFCLVSNTVVAAPTEDQSGLLLMEHLK